MKAGKLHLSLLMFFQLCVVGAISPILSVYFKDYLGFSGIQVGVILSLASIPSIIAPFFSSWVVDRFVTSRQLLALCQGLAAILMGILSFTRSYDAVLITYFIYMILLVPTFALVNTLVFHNMEEAESFGIIRVWGTIGWVVAGWIVNFIMKLVEHPDEMIISPWLSAFFSIIVVFLTLKLPKLALNKDTVKSIIPKEAFRIIIKPEVLLILFAVFISACADKFYFYGTPLFLQSIGVAKDNLLIVLSLGQAPEVIMLFTLGMMIKKIGFKNIFTLALIMQIFRFLIFTINGPIGLTFLGVSLNGFIYALFYAASTIYLDTFTTSDTRGGVHQLFSMVTVGIAGITGNLFAGYLAENFTIGEEINFSIFWKVPLILSVVTFIVLNLFMKRRSKS